MPHPRRISIGCYVIKVGGVEVVIRRMGRSGFRIEMMAGRAQPTFRRLRDAAAAAIDGANPWPFTVEKKFDEVLDLPPFLKRTTRTKVTP